MTPYTRSGLVMLGLVTVMCGAVIVATAPLRRRLEELDRIYSERPTERTLP